jgi:hypothetical protein
VASRLRSTGVVPWALAGVGTTLPFVAGPGLARGLHDLSGPVRTTASGALWLAWGIGLLAAVVPHPVALTTARVLAPAGVAATLITTLIGRDDGTAWIVGVAATLVTTALAFSPAVSLRAVNALAYPNERRFPLRPPGAVLLGPIELAWAFAVAGLVTGPLLLSASVWAAGAVATVSGIPLAALLLRALHGLSRRWVVFVPAGVVLHDLLAMSDPVLFQRMAIERLAPASRDTEALDLTERAPGLALELTLREPIDVNLSRAKGSTRIKARAVLFTPTRPGAVLAEAAARRLPA